MRKIGIVTHCYAGAIPAFATLLRYQLTSLLGHPGINIDYYLCCLAADARVQRIVRYFETHYNKFSIDMWMPDQAENGHRSLFRRSIGRDYWAREAKSNGCELVWFTDVDHYFGENVFTEIFQHWDNAKDWAADKDTMRPGLLWPEGVHIHRAHSIGDALVAGADPLAGGDLGSTPDLNPDDFMEKKYKNAIGGVQIVPAYYAAEFGYCPEIGPREDDLIFPDFRDDITFRNSVLENGYWRLKLPIPKNLYRLRHSPTTYQKTEYGYNG